MLTIDGVDKDLSMWRGTDVLCDWIRALGLNPDEIRHIAVGGRRVTYVEYCRDEAHAPGGRYHVEPAGGGACMLPPKTVRLKVPVPEPLAA